MFAWISKLLSRILFYRQRLQIKRGLEGAFGDYPPGLLISLWEAVEHDKKVELDFFMQDGQFCVNYQWGEKTAIWFADEEDLVIRQTYLSPKAKSMVTVEHDSVEAWLLARQLFL